MANYPLPSTVNVTNFVSVRPWLKDDERSTRYSIWKEQMICLLGSQGLLGFIDGQIPLPLVAEELHEEQKLWRRTDWLIKGWILGSIGEDAIAAVVKLDSSRDVWLKLENIFNLVQDDDIQIQNPTSDSSQNRGEEGEGEGEAAAVVVGGIQNVKAGDENRIVKLQSETLNNVPQQNNEARVDYNQYLPLHRAITNGDWNVGKEFLEQNREASIAGINELGDTALLLAVTTGKNSSDFVRNLLEFMPDDAVVRKNYSGDTVLHRAVIVGNKEAVIMLIDRNPELLYILNNDDRLPVHLAAINYHKEILVRLISKSVKDVENSPFAERCGAVLLLGVIASGFIDVALYLVKNYPDLATSKDENGTYALEEMARTSSIFRSGANFNSWQNSIYSPIVLKSTTDIIIDIEDQSGAAKKLISWAQIFYKIRHLSKRNEVNERMHQEALELVNFLCNKLESLPWHRASPIYKSAIILAANRGIHEVVEAIIKTFPTAIYTKDEGTGRNIFHVAAKERFENVFNLLYQFKEQKHLFYNATDLSGNNYMHMCGDLAPHKRLNLVRGPALQMQHELQWFKRMENFVTPSRRECVNNAGKTPQMLFTEKHQELKTQGEKWFKDTATSYALASVLIASLMLAVAVAVSGGVGRGTALPFFLTHDGFISIAAASSNSLFTAIISLLTFASFYTSRYAEEDFLYVLPMTLLIGLSVLFFSVIFMMIVFTIITCNVLRKRSHSVLILHVSVYMFAATVTILQLPVLVYLMKAAWVGRGIFLKQSRRTLY